jgi:hypothetical protein
MIKISGLAEAHGWFLKKDFLCVKLVSLFYNKSQLDAQISQIYFWNRTVHVSDNFSAHHQKSSTVHTAIGICHTGYADCLLAGSGC